MDYYQICDLCHSIAISYESTQFHLREKKRRERRQTLNSDEYKQFIQRKAESNKIDAKQLHEYMIRYYIDGDYHQYDFDIKAHKIKIMTLKFVALLFVCATISLLPYMFAKIDPKWVVIIVAVILVIAISCALSFIWSIIFTREDEMIMAVDNVAYGGGGFLDLIPIILAIVAIVFFSMVMQRVSAELIKYVFLPLYEVNMLIPFLCILPGLTTIFCIRNFVKTICKLKGYAGVLLAISIAVVIAIIVMYSRLEKDEILNGFRKALESAEAL